MTKKSEITKRKEEVDIKNNKNNSPLSKTIIDETKSDDNDESKTKKPILDQFAHLHHLEGQLMLLLIMTVDSHTSSSARLLKRIESMVSNAKRELNLIDD